MLAVVADLRILYNHWPYGIDTKIIHLVVWTKFDLEDDPSNGELTALMRQKIDDFVKWKFRSRMPENNVCLCSASGQVNSPY